MFFASSFITPLGIVKNNDCILDVYLKPGIYFCYDVVYLWRLNGTRRLYETGRNSRQYGMPLHKVCLFSSYVSSSIRNT